MGWVELLGPIYSLKSKPQVCYLETTLYIIWKTKHDHLVIIFAVLLPLLPCRFYIILHTETNNGVMVHSN